MLVDLRTWVTEDCTWCAAGNFVSVTSGSVDFVCTECGLITAGPVEGKSTLSERTVTRVTTRVEFDDGVFVKFDVEDPMPHLTSVSVEADRFGRFTGPAGWLTELPPASWSTHHVELTAGLGQNPINVEWGQAPKKDVPLIYCCEYRPGHHCPGHDNVRDTCRINMEGK